MNIKLRVRYIMKHRSWFDRLIIKTFKEVFLRYSDQHLAEAHNSHIINNEQLHELDAQMKGELYFKRYLDVDI